MLELESKRTKSLYSTWCICYLCHRVPGKRGVSLFLAIHSWLISGAGSTAEKNIYSLTHLFQVQLSYCSVWVPCWVFIHSVILSKSVRALIQQTFGYTYQGRSKDTLWCFAEVLIPTQMDNTASFEFFSAYLHQKHWSCSGYVPG